MRTLRGRRYLYWRRRTGLVARGRPRYHDEYLGPTPQDLEEKPTRARLVAVARSLRAVRASAQVASVEPAWPRVMHKLGRAHLTWKQYLEQPFLALEINLKELVLLRRLHSTDGCDMAAVARLLFCDRERAAVIVDRLCDKDFAQVDRDPKTGRRSRVTLTRAGKQRLRAAESVSSRVRAKHPDPLAGFRPEDIRRLERLLDRLNDQLASCTTAPSRTASRD